MKARKKSKLVPKVAIDCSLLSVTIAVSFLYLKEREREKIATFL